MELKGTGIYGGIAIGKAFIYRHSAIPAVKKTCSANDINKEVQRWENARQSACREIASLKDSMDSEDDKSKIFEAHLGILNDEEVDTLIKRYIEDEHRNAEWAVESAFNDFIKIISSSKDRLISERTADLTDICRRILKILTGCTDNNLSKLPGKVIVIAHGFLPSDIASIDRENVIGIISETGSITSHSAIIAKSYRISSVSGVKNILSQVSNGDNVIADAKKGTVTLTPKSSIESAV